MAKSSFGKIINDAMNNAEKERAQKKLDELNRIVGYSRFKLKGLYKHKSDLIDYFIVDTKDNEMFLWDSFYGMYQLNKRAQEGKPDAVSAPSRSMSKRFKHDDFYDKPSLEDIEHYGVKGMRWGVRKNPEKAYSKAMKKLSRLDEKVSKAGAKASKAQEKSVRRIEKASSAKLFKNYANKKASRALKKSSRTYLSEQKKIKKAKTWYDAMEDAFKDVSIKNLKPANSDLGKKYIDLVINNSEISSRVADMTQLINYYSKRR